MKRVYALFLISLMVFNVVSVLVPAKVEASGSKLVAFTFDDGPSHHTGRLLDGLKQRGAKATFFMAGANGSFGVQNYRSILHRMIEEGHQLANHTWSHYVPFSALSSGEMEWEVDSVNRYLFGAMGGWYQSFVRIPGGDQSNRIDATVDAPMIFWSNGTEDWKYRNADTVYNHIMDNVRDGSIILLHDIYGTSVDGALRAISTLKSRGYEFVTMAELFRRKGITPRNGVTYYNAYDRETMPAYSEPRIKVSAGDSFQVKIDIDQPEAGVTYYYTEDGSFPLLSSKKVGEASLAAGSTITVVGYDRYGTRTPKAVVTIENPYWGVFNAKYYAEKYPDLKRAFGFDENRLWNHFITYGVSEGRTGSPVFSVNDYMNRFADLKKAFGSDKFAYIKHFVNFGMKEARQAIDTFNVKTYRALYPDLKKTFGGDWIRYYKHFIDFGINEGRIAVGEARVTNPTSYFGGVDYSLVYNFNEYIDRYPDLKRAFQYDDEAAISHFVHFGMREGRIAKQSFDVKKYQSYYTDLRNAFGNDLAKYYLHFIRFGHKEGRKAQ